MSVVGSLVRGMDEDWLSELAAFAHAYPANASHLAEPGMDPDVERLAEAFEFLAAKVHRIVDRGALDMIEPLVELVCPELLRPLPSATIVELAASPPRSRRIPVTAGAELGSVKRDGTTCLFRATSAFDVVPWQLDDARVEWSAEHGQAIVLELTPVKPTVKLESLFPLRLHFANENPHSATLLFFFCRKLVESEMKIHKGPSRPILPRAVRPWGLQRAQSLLPSEPHEHPGFRLLREYFLMPEKFNFAEVHGPVLSGRAERVSLVFRFDSMLPAGIHVTRDTIRLNCVPVINVFEATTDPIQPSLERPIHSLRVAGVDVDHASIYSVRAAQMRFVGEKESRPLPELLAVGAAPSDGVRGAFFRTHAAPKRRPETDLCVAIGAAADAGALPPIELASFDVWATNGTLASSLGVGEVSVPVAKSPPGVEFRNVRRLTPYVSAPRAGGLRERATLFLAIGAHGAFDAMRLRGILRCLDPNGLSRSQAGRIEAKRIAAIEAVVSKPSRVFSRGAVVRGRDIEVTLGQGPFHSEGEVFVLASLLDQLHSHEAPLTTYMRTTVRWTPTGLVLQFPPTRGGRALD
jgi:type VI secretion system protein ImpG